MTTQPYRASALGQGSFAAFMLLVVGLAACGQSDTAPTEKITVANVEEYSTLLWIAQSQGYFEQNGLEVTAKDYQSGKAAGDALIAGDADISTSADFVFVSNSFTNLDLRILGTVDRVQNVELIASKDAGITDPRDLKGKIIGATKKSVGEFFLGTFLTFNGLSLADVQVIDVKPREMADALLRGDVDAVLTWQPNVFDIKEQLGDRAISWPGQSGQPYNMVLMAAEQFVRDRPETVRRFLRSIVQAEEFVRKNNSIVMNSMAEQYDYQSSYINNAWPQHDFVVTLGQELLIIMEDQARWRIENNLTDAKEVPNYLNYIYVDALEAVLPEAVTIIR